MTTSTKKTATAALIGLLFALPGKSQAAGLLDFLWNFNPQPEIQQQPQVLFPLQSQNLPQVQQSGVTVEAFTKGGRPWNIVKNAWSEADEANFSQFVESIYDSGCNTVPKCMSGSGNWYKDKDPAGMTWYADCGRFPYLLRSYFAFHNGLPFQAALVANRRDINDPNSQLQYTAQGNYISKRWAVKSGTNGYQFINSTVQSVYSAVFRVDSRIDTDTGMYSDFYHVALDRKHIRPGTVVYDPNGHIATVAKVTDAGKVILLDSHPDNSVSRVIFTGAFIGTSARQAGGFKNWRQISIVNGKSVASSNANSPGFSLEQFFGDQANKGGFSTAKWSTSDGILPSSRYMEVVRARLSVGAVRYRPVEEVISEVGNICMMMKDRIDSVKAAIDKGIHNNSMPNGRLPGNIYGTSGEWEDYSTPSRDARLKTAIAEFYGDVARIHKLYQTRDAKVIYDGNDLVGDMLRAYDSASADCQMSYPKSDGRTQALDFNDFVKRLYAMSFDPYHCVEQRMGASGAELSSCQQSDTKHAWYKAEQSIRNSLNRPYEKKMGWSLSELQSGAAVEAGVGVTKQTPVDVRAFLMSVR
jgi:hypothetical protein